MKKALLFILALISLNIVILLLLPQTTPFKKKQIVYIAVAGPMSGKDKVQGEAMLRGIRLSLDKLEEEGRLEDKKIELLIFDDRRDRQTALRIASQLAEQNKVLLVLGHYYSPSSGVAGSIYKKNGIPAITASAIADQIFFDNDWYFRVTPSNRFVSGFVADYMKRGMHQTSASIIYDNDRYGSSLAHHFERRAREVGIQIKGKWSFNREGKGLNESLNQITAHLRAIEDPGVIYFATHASEGVKILTILKHPGTSYTVIGTELFSLPSFLENLKAQPNEKKSPGYYSDRVYTILPFMTEVAGQKAYDFRKEYLKEYNHEPTWVAACYYDAMQVAIRAIEKGEIEGEDIRKDRRSVRDSLVRFNTLRTAIHGVTGSIYFDEKGNVQRPPVVGVYDGQRLFPANLQLQYLSGTRETNSAVQEPGGTIGPEEPGITSTRVVYIGIDVFEISDPDVNQNIHTIDFFVWFRFAGEFDDKSIRVINAVTPIQLKEPVLEAKDANHTIRGYRVKADFRNETDTYRYPFDRQTIKIEFRHERMPRKNIIFVSDQLEIPGTVPGKKSGKIMNSLPGWNITRLSRYPDIETVAWGPERNKIDFSRFNAAIEIHRAVWNLVVKIFLPILAMVLILFFIYDIPLNRIGIRSLLIITVPIINTFYYLKFQGVFLRGYLDIPFLTIYGLAAIAAVVSITAYTLERHGKVEVSRFLHRAAKVFHPTVTVVIGIWLSYVYMS